MKTTLDFDIVGMTCGHCSARVSSAIHDAGEFTVVDVDHASGRAHIEADRDLAALGERLVAVIEDAGYDARLTDDSRSAESEPETVSEVSQPAPPEPKVDFGDVKIDVRGMTCASCAGRVSTALEKVPGVHNVAVNYATDVAIIGVDDSFTDIDELVRAVESAGYEAVSVARESDTTGAQDRERLTERRAAEARSWRRRWVAGLILTLPILALQMGPHWLGLHLEGAAQTGRLLTLIGLTAVVVAYVGLPYGRGAWRGLKHFSANMDTLVALGAGVAFLYSTTASIIWLLSAAVELPEIYFDGAAMILTLISVGKHLEARAKGKAGAEIEALLDLAAKKATVRRQGDWVEIDVERVRTGDVMLVKPGEKIPTDGEVIAGRASVDESMLTGESVPASRSEGDQVAGGTINTDGRLEVRATKVGAETALAQIARLVEEAQQSKADAQRLADKVSSVFVPIIIVIAIITFAAWFIATGTIATAVLPAVAVLIVACPCALGLATPTAIMVGTGSAAQSGILIREASALERVRQLDAIVFDKTGTLTRGQMQVTDIVPLTGDDEATVLQIAASLEASSEHPIAAAIVELARTRELTLDELDDFHNEAGSGVVGRFGDVEARVGKPTWIGVEPARAEELEAQGKTVVAVSRGGEVLGMIALRDELKEGAAEVVALLAQRGIDVWMITGDNERTARAIAAEAGISPQRVRAGVVPRDKSDAVQELRQGGERIVAMVGDGVNDAPALATADLGIALGSGTDVAMQSADITLVGDRLDHVIDAIDISNATNRKIKQNLFWAFAYNVVLVPVAALGFLQPMFAAAAMALSSVSVVSNSLLLARRLKK